MADLSTEKSCMLDFSTEQSVIDQSSGSERCMVDLSTGKSCTVDHSTEKSMVDLSIEKSVWWILELKSLCESMVDLSIKNSVQWILALKSLSYGSLH